MLKPREIKKALDLYHNSNMTFAEVAEKVGCSEPTVATVIKRYEKKPCKTCGQLVRRKWR